MAAAAISTTILVAVTRPPTGDTDARVATPTTVTIGERPSSVVGRSSRRRPPRLNTERAPVLVEAVSAIRTACRGHGRTPGSARLAVAGCDGVPTSHARSVSPACADTAAMAIASPARQARDD